MAKGRTASKKVIDITPKETEGPIVSNELVKHIEEKNLPVATQTKIVEILSPVFIKLKEWEQKVESIEIVDENDTKGMLTAAESRKFVKATRIDIKKQVDEQISLIKEDMQPYLDNIEGWKSIFTFAEAVMKSIESKALEKEKYAENLKKKKIDDLRNARAIVAEPLKQFIGFSFDFGIMTDEEFEKLIHNAKLAQKADEDEKARLKKEEDDRLKELENEKRYTNRLNLIYSIGMKKGDGVFFYDNYHVLEDSIRNTEDFDTLFSGIEAKVNDIKAEEKKKQDEIDRIANEAAEAERKRLEHEVENAKASAEQRRILIQDRISQINGATIMRDGLYITYKNKDESGNPTIQYLISYNEIHDCGADEWNIYVQQVNTAWHNVNEEYRVWEEAQNKIRIEQEAQRISDNNAALLKQQEEMKIKVQSEMSDKEKIKSLAGEIRTLVKKIDETFVFQSEMGNRLKSETINMLNKIINYIDK